MAQQNMPQMYMPMGMNPMASPQQRLQGMEQMYQSNGFPQQQQMVSQMPQGYANMPQQMPQQPQFIQQSPIIKGRAVTSIDEVRASMIDLDGSLFVFPDMGNKKVHTKQINLDGTATINTYTLEKPIVQIQNETETIEKQEQKVYIEKGEFDNVVKNFSQQVEDLRKELTETKQTKNNNQRGSN